MNISHFEIKQSPRNGQFRSYAIGKNGRKVWWTEHYEQQAKALNAIRLLDPEGTKPIDVFNKNGNWTKRIEANAAN